MAPLRSILGRAATRLTPPGLRFRLHDAPALQALAGRKPVDPNDVSPEAQERSRSRWRSARPEVGLTWGVQLSGHPFIDKLAEHAELTDATRLLEIGPGYGRLLSAYLEQGRPFASYTGLDLSEHNVRHLSERFPDPRISFLQGEAGSATIPPFDVAMSSLTFKHFYPTFEAALKNSASSLGDGGRVIFDLLEGKRTYFEHDDATYVHCYEPPDVEEIVARAGLRVLAFDHVEHGPNRTRLLVVAGR
ncbi:MAG: class I SAM-dependent methyltransferase [Solirubrobacterales bacterium]|nr:class I SAM-dependent methyltransferase [Solirubrobacterales bacterium]